MLSSIIQHYPVLSSVIKRRFVLRSRNSLLRSVGVGAGLLVLSCSLPAVRSERAQSEPTRFMDWATKAVASVNQRFKVESITHGPDGRSWRLNVVVTDTFSSGKPVLTPFGNAQAKLLKETLNAAALRSDLFELNSRGGLAKRVTVLPARNWRRDVVTNADPVLRRMYPNVVLSRSMKVKIPPVRRAFRRRQP
jgi:hypothetical protein